MNRSNILEQYEQEILWANIIFTRYSVDLSTHCLSLQYLCVPVGCIYRHGNARNEFLRCWQ